MGSSLAKRRGPTGERPPVRVRLVRLSVLGPSVGADLESRRLVRLR